MSKLVIRRCSTSFISGKIRIKATIWYHFTHSRITEIQRQAITNFGRNGKILNFIRVGTESNKSSLGKNPTKIQRIAQNCTEELHAYKQESQEENG